MHGTINIKEKDSLNLEQGSCFYRYVE